ncbi:riboflavin synthase [Pelagicoccus sp. SDUM812003]|uniref:riboflavin synthase n=1 Tax=Pelagicoccus sp. SDUM812003 TaxID=3041267 RepID=UPI00280D3F82|nr:riboflavin synthase [Pelagicoccus sp. SDUM812003]MDQ8202950.1 riboflavin synthase [Pelagicoccus sp. SDUM812003]
MFTGIVEEKGRVVSLEELEGSWRYTVAVETVSEGLSIGDSLATNGVCLTVVEVGDGTLSFDVLEETRRVTNLRFLETGGTVNLERSLRFDGRIGGHFVSGHVDCTGVIKTLRPEGKDVLLQIEIPEGFEHYVVYKGCIAIDGMSLTIAKEEGRLITIWLIPHTMEVTTIGERKAGDLVNLEFDLIAKYTEKIVAQRG